MQKLAEHAKQPSGGSGGGSGQVQSMVSSVKVHETCLLPTGCHIADCIGFRVWGVNSFEGVVWGTRV